MRILLSHTLHLFLFDIAARTGFFAAGYNRLAAFPMSETIPSSPQMYLVQLLLNFFDPEIGILVGFGAMEITVAREPKSISTYKY